MSQQDQSLAAALKSGHRIQFNLLEAGPDIDIVDKKNDVSVYKMIRYRPREPPSSQRRRAKASLTACVQA